MGNVDNFFDEMFENMDITEKSDAEVTEILKQSAKEAGMQVYDTTDNKDRPVVIATSLKDEYIDIAVNSKLIPESYKHARFDVDKIKDNLIKQYAKSKLYKIHKFNEYTSICMGILSAIRLNQLPRRSYLIGAPNGFGKSSFVNECIITLKQQGFTAVPYISLWELAQIRIEDEKMLMNPYIHPRYKMDEIIDKRRREFEYTETNNSFEYTNTKQVTDYFKKPGTVTGLFSFSEYINADCLFVQLTSILSKEIESHTLKQVLDIRAAKGLPTIVMMSTSLEPYINDPVLRDLVWNEILSYNEDDNSYDRVYHIACYKTKELSIDNKGAKVDSRTGIVLGE